MTQRTTLRRNFVAPLIAGLMVACGGDSSPEGSDTASTGGASSTDASATGHGDASSTPPEPKAAGPTFTAQPGWTKEDPASNQRVAQFAVAEGEISLIVFYWRDGVGGLDTNIGRWIGPDRDPNTLSANELKEIEVGDYVAHTLFLETEPGNKSDEAHGPTGGAIFRAYIEEPGSTTGHAWTVKADGPREAMLRERDAFEAFIQSL